MIEAILSFFFRLVWFAATQLLGYWTGRTTIQILSLGRIDVAKYGEYNRKPFKVFWYRGSQPIASFMLAIVLGQLLWFGLFCATMIYLSRG